MGEKRKQRVSAAIQIIANGNISKKVLISQLSIEFGIGRRYSSEIIEDLINTGIVSCSENDLLNIADNGEEQELSEGG